MKEKMDAILKLLELLKIKDENTWLHCVRCANMAKFILSMQPEICTEYCHKSTVTGILLHDIGKLLVPKDILKSNMLFSEGEMKIMRLHTINGHALISGIVEDECISKIILQHHERPDGKGYPSGLRGNSISQASLFCSVLDVLDVMLHGRAYQASLSFDDSICELRKFAGTQFDKKIVSGILNCANELENVIGKNEFSYQELLS